jgi:WD40 repeat protein
MIKKFWIIPILLTLILTGCSSDTPEAFITDQSETPTFTQSSTTTGVPTIASTPAPILTPSLPLPSLTSTHPPTPLPTATPLPTITPAVWGNGSITTENASELVQRAVWGLGAPEEAEYASDGSVFIQSTPLGIYIYLAESMELVRFLPEGREYFLSPAGDLLFIRIPDGSLLVIDLPSGLTRHTLAPIATLTPRMKDAVYAQLPANRLATEAMYFELVTTMTAIAISQDGNLAAIGFGLGSGLSRFDSYATLGIWDMQTGNLVMQLQTHIVKNISKLVFSPNDEKLLAEGQNGEIAVWQLVDGLLLWRQPNIGHVVGQPFSPDSSFLALEIDTGDSTDVLSWVTVRDARYGGEQGSQVVGKVASAAISPDNTRMLTTWWDTISIWAIPNLQLVDIIRTDLIWPQASYSDDGKYILLNDGQQAYGVSDLRLDQSYPKPMPQAIHQMDIYTLHQMGFISNALGLRYPQPDIAFAWGIVSDHEAWVWDLANNIHTSYDFGSPYMAEPDLSFHGDRLAACTTAGLLVVNLVDNAISNLGRCRASGEVRFSVDGSKIFRTNGLLVDVVDSLTGTLLHNYRWHQYNLESLAVTQDGAYLISTSEFQYALGREVVWWQLDPPIRLWEWWVNVYPAEQIFGAVFQQDGHVLHTALGGLRSWRFGDGIQHHLDTNRIHSLTISPDQNLLAGGDLDGIIHLWSLENWQEVATITGHLDTINGLVFSPNSAGLLSLSQDGTIRLWGLP